MKKLVSLVLSRRGSDIALLVLRVAAGIMLMTHGIAKISNFSQLSVSFADPIGLGTKVSLILMILAEVGASAFIVLGLLTRPAALVLMFGLSVAAFASHGAFDFSASELPLLYLLMFTVLLISGGGKFSADEILRRSWEKRYPGERE